MGPLSFFPIQHTAGEFPGELLNVKEVSANLEIRYLSSTASVPVPILRYSQCSLLDEDKTLRIATG